MFLGLLFLSLPAYGEEASTPVLADAACRLQWQHRADGWHLGKVEAAGSAGNLQVGTPSGEYTFLYSESEPSHQPDPMHWVGRRECLEPAALNVAGEARSFFPEEAAPLTGGGWAFSHSDDTAEISAAWATDSQFPGDVRVTLTLKAKKTGWFSLASPTLTEVAPADLAWAVVPGYFQGAATRPDLSLAYAYGQGLPDRPVVARERTVSTLASIMTAKSGATLAVIADPGTGADPWESDRDTRAVWRLGLSHMNRKGALAPTLYHPVLGENGSLLQAGQSVTFGFRYSLRAGDWFAAENHAVYDVYRFADFLSLKHAERSLSERMLAQRRFVENDQTSLWRTEDDNGLKIGAQAYLGGVAGADKDAMKNSDYGAMWMLAQITGDPALQNDRLPFARNFKLAQQQTEAGFFQGAAAGQYYLAKSKRFVEEAGGYVEPIGLTFYTLIDMGNILLFTPGDTELRDRLRLGADQLLKWQHPDGSWDVAYDRKTEQPRFPDLLDLRATFYGLLVAHRILGDEKYLAGAKRGADWLLENAVAKGSFLGVCGDTRFAPDFATGQLAQALFDLFGETGDARYRDAAIATARFYTTSVYTHPIPSTAEKQAGGRKRMDWEITQVGLSFEHGGAIGSANGFGPILLASHAGLFIRMYGLTQEPLFRDMARAGALARDAFVDQSTGVATYYWKLMNKGAGHYPQHAWWQIGWITDYLVSEAALRFHDRITFPHGFVTPKVGPHACYGFAPGQIDGEPVLLHMAEGLVKIDSPDFDYLVARSAKGTRLFVIILNDQAAASAAQVTVAPSQLAPERPAAWKKAALLDPDGTSVDLPADRTTWSLTIPGFGAKLVELDYEMP